MKFPICKAGLGFLFAGLFSDPCYAFDSKMERLRDDFIKRPNEFNWVKLSSASHKNNPCECWCAAIRYADARNAYLLPNSMALLPGNSIEAHEDQLKKNLDREEKMYWLAARAGQRAGKYFNFCVQ